MMSRDYLQIGLFLLLIIAFTPLLGTYIARIFSERKPLRPFLIIHLENFIYQMCQINPFQEMSWKTYTLAVVIFHAFGLGLLLVVQMVQQYMPLNPQNLPGVPFLLAFNTAISFITNTNWQAYAGETTMSYFTQMFGLTVQNFLSAASAIAVVMAFIRGFSRQSTQSIGNFWSDLVKSTLYILLPLSVILSIVLVQQGVVQSFSPYIDTVTIEGQKQTIPLGPAASQIAIKQLGTNGGGFFNANSAHPFENPTPLSNFLEILVIFLIPAALTYTFGKMTGSTKQGWVLFGAMLTIFLCVLSASLFAEYQYNPLLNIAGSMEGKEVRFGIAGSSLFSVVTTAASCGAVNCWHESLSPVGGLVTMFNMMLGEIVFGGVGSGLYGMLLYAIITVFIAGLMVGRTPEYLGKKIHSFEVKLSVIGILASSVLVLILAAIACSTKAGTASVISQGLVGFNEILYAFSSAANNNGSAFGGLGANNLFYNLTTAIAMLLGRFTTLIAALAIAGSLAAKKSTPPSSGTFPTGGMLFLVLLVGTILIVGALNFFPVLSLGPIIEHLLMLLGKGI
jgi:K+-transporting ATPase ATPase A chain